MKSEKLIKKGGKNKSIFDSLLEIGCNAAILMVIFLALGINARVIIRYTFGFPINWVIDVSTILQVFLTFIAAAWLLREEGHISIDIVLSFLRPRSRFFLQIINSIICILICAFITIYGTIETWSSWKAGLYLNMPLEPPKWTVLIIIPLGSLFLFLQFIRRTKDFLKRYRSCINENK